MTIDMSSREKRKKFKPRRGVGQAVTRKRRQAADAVREMREARDQKEREAARAEMARQRLAAASATGMTQDNEKWGGALLRTVVHNQTALLRSWGHKQSVDFSVAKSTSNVIAYTDFKKIVVTWPKAKLPPRMDRVGTLDTIAQMKGIMQHEMGHVRFTTPWTEVQAKSRYAARYYNDADMVAMHTCWNLLEDQRMESLVVEAVPRISGYFATMVFNIVLHADPSTQSWLLLAGREYISDRVRKSAAAPFNAWCDELGVANGAQRWLDLVNAYKAASTHQQIMDAVATALDFIRIIKAAMPPSVDDHSNMENENPDASPADTSRGEGGGGSVMDLFNDPPEKKGAGEGGGKGEAGEGEGEGEGEEGEGFHRDNYGDAPREGAKNDKKRAKRQDGQPASQSNGGDESPEIHDSEDMDLHREIMNSMEDISAEVRNHHDVREVAFSAGESMDRDGLPEYEGIGEAMPDDLVARAATSALGIEEALNSFLTQNQPTWYNQQEVGIVDARAYRTKEVGARDYRRHLEGDEFSGLDVHVSMLCDVSMSMGGEPMIALSESLYATALACEKLGIGSTYTLWSSGNANYRVWSDSDPTPTIFPSMGGTEPTKALDDLATHNPEGAANHLVMIFTDGAWAHNFPSLQRWKTGNKTFVLIRYRAYDGDVQKDMGADEHIQIQDVGALPGELSKALIDVLSSEEGGW